MNEHVRQSIKDAARTTQILITLFISFASKGYWASARNKEVWRSASVTLGDGSESQRPVWTTKKKHLYNEDF